MGLNSGLVASVRAGRIIVTRMTARTPQGLRSVPGHGRPDMPSPPAAGAAGGDGARAERRTDQIRPSSRTASRSSVSSFTEASIRAREKSLISRPWTISYLPSFVVTGKDEMMPSGTP